MPDSVPPSRTSSALPGDYTRCMGLTPKCPVRDRCARHCDIPDDRAVSWVRNLNPSEDAQCLYFIEYRNG